MIALKVSDDVLKKALELKLSDCYGAMSMANALGGSPSPEWDTARGNKVEDLLAEARHRKINVTSWKGAVTDNPIVDHAWYKTAEAKLSRLDGHGAKYNGKVWKLDGIVLGETVSLALEAIEG